MPFQLHSALTSLAASTRAMVPHAEDSDVGHQLAEKEWRSSNAEADLHVPRCVHKQMFLKVCATLAVACLVVGFAITNRSPTQFHEIARVLSAHTNQSQSISSPRQFLRPPLRPRVNTLCVCNTAETMVQLRMNGQSRLPGSATWSVTSLWFSRQNPCGCFHTGMMQVIQQEGGELQCWYTRQTAVNVLNPSRTRFIYSRHSQYAGRYMCSGVIPTCRYDGYCQGIACLQTH